LALDQFTKWLALRELTPWDERVIIPGFFNLACRANTGAAWSLLTGKNTLLALVAIAAIVLLARMRHHFSAHRLTGQIALGLIFGGILGNLADRLFRSAVVDFLHFYMARRGTTDVWDFPAFNVADSAICVGVAFVFILTWKNESVMRET
jgi:signal peptidase II